MTDDRKPGARSDYFAERVRAEVAFARSRGATTPEALADYLNTRGFMTREGRPWTAVEAEAFLTRSRPRDP